MKTVLELFSLKEILDYLKTREYEKMLGEELFPEVKKQSLEFDMLVSGSRTPVIASVHGFDTEAEIGEREAQKMIGELALIKRKMQLTEKEVIALEHPRDKAEQKALMKNVYNDIDKLVNGIRARIELMRMELTATGKITLNENNLTAVIDYGVPEEHKVANVAWDGASADPIADILEWYNKMETKPSRALTSNTVLMKILRNPNVAAQLYGPNATRLPSVGELNTYLKSLGLPAISIYDAVYRKKKAVGKGYDVCRYFPENAFVMMPSTPLGETLYGPTAEETRLSRNADVNMEMMGKIIAFMYETDKDPVGTWEKAVATALPTLPYVDELFQAQIKLA